MTANQPLPIVCTNCHFSNVGRAVFCQKCGGKVVLECAEHTRYRPIQVLKPDGVSTVFLAHGEDGCNYVLKRLSMPRSAPEEVRKEAGRRFYSEGYILSKLSHPLFPKYYGQFSEGEAVFLVLEYVLAGSMEQDLRQRGAYLAGEAITYVEQIAAGLAHLHRGGNGCGHRDIKPANLLMASPWVKLIDFGETRPFALSGKVASTGTEGYVAPEQCVGTFSIRSEVYSLGVTVHTMLTGYDPAHSPFQLPPVADLKPHLGQQVSLVIAKALAHRPDERYESPGAFYKALRAALAAQQLL